MYDGEKKILSTTNEEKKMDTKKMCNENSKGFSVFFFSTEKE